MDDSQETTAILGFGGSAIVFLTLSLMTMLYFVTADISPPLLFDSRQVVGLTCAEFANGSGAQCTGNITTAIDTSPPFNNGISIQGPTNWGNRFFEAMRAGIFVGLVSTTLVTGTKAKTNLTRGWLAILGAGGYFFATLGAIWLGLGVTIQGRSGILESPLIVWLSLVFLSGLGCSVFFHYLAPFVPKTVSEDTKEDYLKFQWRLVQLFLSISLALIAGITIPLALSQGLFGLVGGAILVAMLVIPVLAVLGFYMWRIYLIEVPEEIRNRPE